MGSTWLIEPTTKNMIAVFGSLNMDFVVRVERLPLPGETVSGSSFITIPGGKGANQAYAAARLGAQVRMIGAVGRDHLGARLKSNLTEVGADISFVEDSETPTGTALITVDAQGQNSIVVSPGANGTLGVPDARVFEGVSIALFQLEVPMSSVLGALRLAKKAGATTILDPAPVAKLSREVLDLVDILTPNETEASVLQETGVESLVLKLGAKGCTVRREGQEKHFPAFPVRAVDTTAAGDTFNAALACALSEGKSWDEAVPFANAAAAISVMRLGAQASAPSAAEVKQFLERH